MIVNKMFFIIRHLVLHIKTRHGASKMTSASCLVQLSLLLRFLIFSPASFTPSVCLSRFLSSSLILSLYLFKFCLCFFLVVFVLPSQLAAAILVNVASHFVRNFPAPGEVLHETKTRQLLCNCRVCLVDCPGSNMNGIKRYRVRS